MSLLLFRYLELEKSLDDDHAADDLRDAMDALWYKLSDEERSYLDSRPA